MKIKFLLLLMLALLSFHDRKASADLDKSCGKSCHENPQFTRADKTKLKECIVCHAPSAHGVSRRIVPFRITAEAYAETNGPDCLGENCRQKSGEKVVTSEMILVPEGEFIMGSNDRLKDERPAHVVYGKPFQIDVYEVTNEQYKSFLDQTGYGPPEHWNRTNFPKEKGKHPVTYVSWHDADNYCKWAGKRLPREWEWEKGARGNDGRVYPWGNVWDMHKSNNPLQALGDTRPVGSYEKGKSPYGLYDMSGNVWEWVDDHYFPHPGSDYVNPEFGVKYRLLKGGSYWDCSFYACGISAPVYNRAFFEPEVKGESYGFRCAKDAD